MVVSLQRARDALRNQGSDSTTKEKRFGGPGEYFSALIGVSVAIDGSSGVRVTSRSGAPASQKSSLAKLPVQRSVGFFCLGTATSPEAPGKPRSTFVDTALAFDVGSQRFIQVFEFRRVPQNPRPLTASPIIRFLAICGAKDHGREWFW